ncbi:Succinate dehydrogenase flavoprotein subunit [Salmonella enterica subsp. arizonae]|nr:Succinate dehydrogenase flavoprotein subunit [Salmonella enterica subsp. arizonae]
MQFDPQIVAQANAFVNALRSGKRAPSSGLKAEILAAIYDSCLRWPRPRVM